MSKPMLIEALKPGMRAMICGPNDLRIPVYRGEIYIHKGDNTGGGICSAVEWLTSTDYEIIPSGPKKRDVIVSEITAHVPRDMIYECRDAFDLIGRLMQWEGAQIGKAGWIMSFYSEGQYVCSWCNRLNPDRVSFKTIEQCRAAWKAECPELMEASHDTA